MHIDDLETPALVIDFDKLDENINKKHIICSQ
jgi:D-serine deaminase-like pyridoxal phosphate-dependent protein